MSKTPQIVAAIISLVAVASPGEASPAPMAGITPPATTVEHPAISDAARAQKLDQRGLNQQNEQAKPKHKEVMYREVYNEWIALQKKTVTRVKRYKKTLKSSDAGSPPVDAHVTAVFKAMKPNA